MRRMAGAGCVAALLCSVAYAGETETPLRWQPGQRVIFEGDSGTSRRSPKDGWTWPFLQLMDWEHTWADYLGQMVFCWRPDLNIHFSNFAVGGSKSFDLLDREAEVIKAKPDWLLITIGGNDCSVQLPVNEFEKNIAGYAERVHQETGAQIVFINHRYDPPDRAARYPRDADFSQRRQQYREALERVAAERTYVHCVDITPFLQSCADRIYQTHPEHTILNDGGHYNNVGAVIMAGAVMQVFDLFPKAVPDRTLDQNGN